MSVIDVTPDVARGCLPPPPQEDGDKHDRGTLLVVAGGGASAGAALLAGLAGLRVGAGRLRMAAPRDLAPALSVAVPEALIIRAPGGGGSGLSRSSGRRLSPYVSSSDAVIVGPGMINDEAARRVAADLLQASPETPFIVDAAAMPCKADAAAFADLAQGRVILTPHAGEMAGLLDEPADRVRAAPVAAATQAANLFKSVVVLKGAVTIIASPTGGVWRHQGGVSGLATSGSGDVLAGAIGGLLARGSDCAHAAVAGVFLHAQTGARLARSMPIGFLAGDLPPILPQMLAELVNG